MKNFITNSGTENLRKRINELINKSEELKFLVGFFYFSGIRELYDELKKNQKVKIKVLVGLNVDIFNYQIIEYADKDDQKGNLSTEEIQQKFFDSIKKSINSEMFDTYEFYEQVKFFIELIKQDRLIIRKTVKPNHSKLYIFKLEGGQVGRKNLFITGSSNLTKTALTTQEEFNVEISDYGFEDAEAYFDHLWENESVPITEDYVQKKKLIEIVEKETLIKEITPFEAFVLVLKIYLETFEQKEIGESIKEILEKNGYVTYQYQLDAISQALTMIEKNNGVILADVVGLGKTIIACALAWKLKKRGVIICPPGIMGDPKTKDSGWYMYKEQFHLYDWEVWSLGDLEKLQEVIRTKLKDIEVVIIDEAHRFRNQDTKSYEYLKNICRNKIVILITATPFNNRPGDILSLLKLFVTPKKSTITLESNLADKFSIFKNVFDQLAYIKKYYNSNDIKKRKKARDYYKSLFEEEFIPNRGLEKVKDKAKYLAKEIRNVIEPVTIRRNRLDLELNSFYKDEVKDLSKVADPKEWFFELTKEQSIFYDKIITDYFADPDDGGKFKGAIYRPFEYETERIIDKLSDKESFEYYSQRNLYDYMRRLLVKRFESSFGAFEQSLKNFKYITEVVQKFVNKTQKYILDRELLERIYDKDIDEIELYLKEYAEKITQGEYPKNHKIYELSKFKYKDKFLEDIASDIKLFDEILNILKRLKLVEEGNDPKAKSLIYNLKKELKKEPNRKIVIFSEYLDTVKYLKPILEKEFPNRVLVIEGNLNTNKIKEINTNFDASYKEQENSYDILLSTDRISEGFNLNRAGMVINYDIPWNPVRVIQRVGRINRISKKVFDELYIVNFFPTEKGAELVKSREIAQNKMFLIHNTLGEDAKIFDIDEEPTPAKLYERIQQNPDRLEEESFYTKAINIYREIKEKYPELIFSLDKFPLRVKVAKKSNEDELLVFIKKNRLYILGAKYLDKKPYETSFEEIFEKIRCEPDEEKLELSEKFWDVYEKIKSFKGNRSSLKTDKSLEQKAIHNLKTFIHHINDEELNKLKGFLKTLLEDIIDYGTLTDYTLRRIINLENKDKEKLKKSIEEIKKLKDELGEDYLEKEKASQKNLMKEIIVAIENKKI
ncbi:MAG: helicase-related protein [Caldisericia bacterium]